MRFVADLKALQRIDRHCTADVTQIKHGSTFLGCPHTCAPYKISFLRATAACHSTLGQQFLLGQQRQCFATDPSLDAKPIKSKGMTAGTLPPATEQVPPDTQTQVKEQATAAVQQTLAAASERERPERKAGPAGLDQVPGSMHSDSQHQNAASPILGTGVGANAASASASSADTPDLPASLSAAESGPSGEDPKGQGTSISGWQRFRWLCWGTPPEYWKRGSNTAEPTVSSAVSGNSQPASASSSQQASVEGGGVAGGQDSRGGRFSLARIIERAILGTRVVRDEDVAR